MRGRAELPTGGDWVSCLVSGGERSSALAWMAALSGFSLRLVHSRTDEAALRHVARLYSELSFRMDAALPGARRSWREEATRAGASAAGFAKTRGPLSPV